MSRHTWRSSVGKSPTFVGFFRINRGPSRRDARTHCVVAAGLAAALLLGACGGDSGGTATPPKSPKPVASSAGGETVASSPSAPSRAESPEDAALGLYDAWLAGDSDAAGASATARAVNELFAHPASEIDFNSCARTAGKYTCFFYYEGGGLNMVVEGDTTTGFLVTKAFFVAD